MSTPTSLAPMAQARCAHSCCVMVGVVIAGRSSFLVVLISDGGCGPGRASTRGRFLGALERRFVGVAGSACGGAAPRVIGRRGALPACGGVLPGRLVHPGGGVPQRRADLVDGKLDDGALLAFLGFVGPLLQP